MPFHRPCSCKDLSPPHSCVAFVAGFPAHLLRNKPRKVLRKVNEVCHGTVQGRALVLRAGMQEEAISNSRSITISVEGIDPIVGKSRYTNSILVPHWSLQSQLGPLIDKTLPNASKLFCNGNSALFYFTQTQ